MHDAYYSPHPLLVLKRPVALTGFFGARLPQVAAVLSATTGVPLGDLERIIEHRTGRSLTRFVFESGQEALHREEEAALGALLRQTPPAIIALGPATLQHAPSARLLRRHARLIYIKHSVLALYGNLLDELDGATSRCWLFPGRRPQSVGELHPAFLQFREGYESAEQTIEAAGRSPQSIARQLIAQLDANPPA